MVDFKGVCNCCGVSDEPHVSVCELINLTGSCFVHMLHRHLPCCIRFKDEPILPQHCGSSGVLPPLADSALASPRGTRMVYIPTYRTASVYVATSISLFASNALNFDDLLVFILNLF